MVPFCHQRIFFFVKEQNIILQSLKKVVLHFIHFIQCSRFFVVVVVVAFLFSW